MDVTNAVVSLEVLPVVGKPFDVGEEEKICVVDADVFVIDDC